MSVQADFIAAAAASQTGIMVAALATLAMGVAIVALSLNFYLSVPTTKDVFESVVVHALLPMFNTIVTAVLAWIFGKPIALGFAAMLAK